MSNSALITMIDPGTVFEHEGQTFELVRLHSRSKRGGDNSTIGIEVINERGVYAMGGIADTTRVRIVRAAPTED